jgi:hypothetical protein
MDHVPQYESSVSPDVSDPYEDAPKKLREFKQLVNNEKVNFSS